MRTTTLRAALALFALLPCAPAAAQVGSATWSKQAPIPTPKNLLSVSAVSADEMWATAGALFAQTGDLVHTTDGGQTWDVVPVNGSSTLNAVFFLDAQHGWAAGNGFFHTVDGGQTWVQDNTWGSIYDLFFVDAQHGWAAGNGGLAYRTVDGGNTWQVASTPSSGTLRSVWFSDVLRGWAVGIDGRVVRTVDGGSTWTLAVDLGSGGLGVSGFPNTTTVQFVDTNRGWVIGGKTFARTTDGGQTWSLVPVPSGTWAHGAAFADALHGVAVGDAGNVVVTSDGGQTWATAAAAGSGQRLWCADFADGVGYLVGENGVVERSLDLGRSWEQVSSGAALTVRDLCALDARTAWVANEVGEIALTVDGGDHWERVSVEGFDAYGDLYAIDFADELNGWVAGQQQVFGLADDGRISRSTDGGRTWTLQYSQSAVEFFGLEALDADTAIAFGRGNFASSAYLRTEDGGQTWFGSGPNGTTNGFRDAFFLPDRLTGWLVGNGIHRTDDGGLTWTLQHPGTGQGMFSSVSFADPLHGWACGFQNLLLRTTDGGRTWVPQDAGGPSGAAYVSVSAISPDEAVVAGWQRFAARTTDGGATWQSEPLPPPTNPLYPAANVEWNAVHFLDAGNGWLAGNEAILAMRDGATLVGSPGRLSVKLGGVQRFTLRPGPAHAGQVFVLVGGASGTAPGFLDPASGLTVPIAIDGYTLLLLGANGAGLVTPLFGVVGQDGFATAELTVPAATDPSFAGLELHHAHALLEPLGGGALVQVSNPVALELVR